MPEYNSGMIEWEGLKSFKFKDLSFKIKVNYLFWDKECLDSKISKNR